MAQGQQGQGGTAAAVRPDRVGAASALCRRVGRRCAARVRRYVTGVPDWLRTDPPVADAGRTWPRWRWAAWARWTRWRGWWATQDPHAARWARHGQASVDACPGCGREGARLVELDPVHSWRVDRGPAGVIRLAAVGADAGPVYSSAGACSRCDVRDAAAALVIRAGTFRDAVRRSTSRVGTAWLDGWADVGYAAEHVAEAGRGCSAAVARWGAWRVHTSRPRRGHGWPGGRAGWAWIRGRWDAVVAARGGGGAGGPVIPWGVNSDGSIAWLGVGRTLGRRAPGRSHEWRREPRREPLVEWAARALGPSYVLDEWQARWLLDAVGDRGEGGAYGMARGRKPGLEHNGAADSAGARPPARAADPAAAREGGARGPVGGGADPGGMGADAGVGEPARRPPSRDAGVGDVAGPWWVPGCGRDPDDVGGTWPA